MSGSKYGPDWVPEPGEQAAADRRLAATRSAVDALVTYALGLQFANRPLPIMIALEACDHAIELAGDDDDSVLPAATGMLGVAVARIVELTHELEKCRAAEGGGA